jgi:hypothetical protein
VPFTLPCEGLGIGRYPWVVPREIDIRTAAAPQSSLVFLPVGAVLLLLVLGYTIHAYWVLRGKVSSDEGRHRWPFAVAGAGLPGSSACRPRAVAAIETLTLVVRLVLPV